MFGRGARASILSEPGALATDLPCGPVRAVPLRRGPMAVHLIEIGLGDVLLQSGRSTPVALLGTLSRATVLLALPLDGREAMALNGRLLQPRCVAAFGAGAGYEAASPRDCAWATVVLPAAAAAGALLGRRRLPPALRPGAHALLRASPAAWARAEALARDACAVAAEDPGVFEVAEARRALRSAVLETADALLASPADAAVGTLFFGWSTVRLHRAAGRPGDPGHGRRLRWRIVPIAARLGMTKALSHGSICGRVKAMRSSGSCNTSTVSRSRRLGRPPGCGTGAVLPNTDSVCVHVRSWRALDCLRSGCGGVDGATAWRARSRTCNISPAELTHGQIESGAFGAQRHARA
jgi:hypothetical protein